MFATVYLNPQALPSLQGEGQGWGLSTQLLCLQHEKLPLSAESALEKVSF